MNGWLVAEHLPHVAEERPVVGAARVPQHDLHVLHERVVGVLRHVTIAFEVVVITFAVCCVGR